MTVTISSIKGEQILDSRGVPTLLITVSISDGSTGKFAVPSGASTGVHEAAELRDDGTSHGGVGKAVAYIEGEISETLVGRDITAQKEIDDLLIKLDGTDNKSRLGGNTLIGISIALIKAAAQSNHKEVWDYLHEVYFADREVAFPRLYANIVNGGKHAATNLAFQEYHVVPKTRNVKDALQLITRIQEKLHEVSQKKFGDVTVGDEGGYALPLKNVQEPLDLFEEITRELGVRDQVDFALDVAASSFFNEHDGTYTIGDEIMTSSQLLELYKKFEATYDLLSIEDPFSEEDFASFTELQVSLSSTMLVGDDLTTTNVNRLKRAVEARSVKALIIKPNQIGTLSETIKTMQYARAHGIECIISHRSGETLDDFIADLAYASGAFGIKAGARGPKEREAKYTRLLEIETNQI